jgi:hypothetical protein
MEEAIMKIVSFVTGNWQWLVAIAGLLAIIGVLGYTKVRNANEITALDVLIKSKNEEIKFYETKISRLDSIDNGRVKQLNDIKSRIDSIAQLRNDKKQEDEKELSKIDNADNAELLRKSQSVLSELMDK